MVNLFLMSWLKGHLKTFGMNYLFLIICLQSLYLLGTIYLDRRESPYLEE